MNPQKNYYGIIFTILDSINMVNVYKKQIFYYTLISIYVYILHFIFPSLTVKKFKHRWDPCSIRVSQRCCLVFKYSLFSLLRNG